MPAHRFFLLHTASAALEGGDVDGAYVAAYDAYRLAALLAQQGLRATGGDGSHMTVEDAVSAQFGTDIPAFAKRTFERFRRTRHSAQYFDPNAAPITKADASWAIAKAKAALSGRRQSWQLRRRAGSSMGLKANPEHGTVRDRVVEGAGA